MADWLIAGVDRETGDPRRLEVAAADEDQAVKLAGDRGIMVASVERRRPQPKVAPPAPQPKPPTRPDDDIISTGTCRFAYGFGVCLILFGGCVGMVSCAEAGEYSASIADVALAHQREQVGLLIVLIGVLMFIGAKLSQIYQAIVRRIPPQR